MSVDSTIEAAVLSVRKLLPQQGPLPYFVHHNPLHHFEDLTFEEAAKHAALLYQARAFMPEQEFQKLFLSGRIERKDIESSLNRYLAQHNIQVDSSLVFDLFTAPRATTKHSDQRIENFIQLDPLIKHGYYKEAVAEIWNRDIDDLVGPVALRFFAAYFDFGSAYWQMPCRNLGLWGAFSRMYSESMLFPAKFSLILKECLASLSNKSAIEIIQELLSRMALPSEHISEYIFELLYRYKGWVALCKSLEDNPDWIHDEDIKPSFVEMTAIILCLEFCAISSIGNIRKLKVPFTRQVAKFDRAFLANAIKILKLSDTDRLPEFLRYFSDLDRQSIWQSAFEEKLYRDFLAAYKDSAITKPYKKSSADFQVFCCIDEREESFRRYLEATAPNCETFGVAGHFSLDMKFRGIFDKHFRALCPPVIKPEKYIWEEKAHEKISLPKTLAMYGELQWINATSSKTLIRGFVQSFISGLFNLIPYSLDIVSPQLMAKVKQAIRNQVHRDVETKLVYQQEQGNEKGYSLSERTIRAESVLRSAGLVSGFSPFVFMLGHGSSSLNNPHEAAHDCGACAGGRGAPNGRLIAEILNEEEVRAELRKKGIDIPSGTRFFGGYHNTCSDEVILFGLPEKLTPDLKSNLDALKRAAHLNARERCRRFDDVRESPSDMNFYDYTQGRALDLTQPRPEYGHATNAFCIVGPRRNSRNLFTDRRAFLVSYDNNTDPDGTILSSILQAVGPVCAGISLEYYFSFIDNEHYGCGTKLPHNVTSLVGVMNGYQSDLLLGLPWQMVEIHEPTRLLLVVCCPLEVMENLLKQLGPYQRLVKNGWIQLCIHDEKASKLYRFQGGKFAETSIDLPVPNYEREDLRFIHENDHLKFGTFA